MNLLLPHPLFALPTREVVEEKERRFGKALAAKQTEDLLVKRFGFMMNERKDPFIYGYRPPIWRVADELLIDGKEVVLVDPDWDVNDPELRKIRPPDFLKEAARRAATGEGKIVIRGAPELWIAGSNRSSKSEYCARKINEVMQELAERRTWSFADTEAVSHARQQPQLWRYVPASIKDRMNAKGKLREGTGASINWNGRHFVNDYYKFPNGSQNWCRNYSQDVMTLEGEQLDAAWLDEARDPQFVRTIRIRLGDRRGILLVSFTSINLTFTAIVDEYEQGSKTLLEVDAEMLPLKGLDGKLNGKFYKVPRVKIAGPGSEGNQRANILYFHIQDNPYYGFEWNQKKLAAGKRTIFGPSRFYELFPPGRTTRDQLLSRVYGLLPRQRMQQFRYRSAVHDFPLERLPRIGTRYHIVDPCPGRNWFMIWILIDPLGRWFIYREWPSTGHNEPSASVPGVGDPGPWATAGGSRSQVRGQVAMDGSPGPAQAPFGWGLERYRDEIFRLEGRDDLYSAKFEGEPRPVASRRLTGGPRRQPGPRAARRTDHEHEHDHEHEETEQIFERWMDSRYGSAPTVAKEAPTTNIIEMSKIGMEFRAAPSEMNITNRSDGSIEKINQLLDFDDDVELGEFSARLGRLNEPQLFVADTCPNTRFALKEWTGRDGNHGACKDPADCLRYAVLCELDYVGEEMFKWKGGGHY